MSDKYWTLLINKNPKMTKSVIQVVTQEIIINTSDPSNPNTDVRFAHVLTSPVNTSSMVHWDKCIIRFLKSGTNKLVTCLKGLEADGFL